MRLSKTAEYSIIALLVAYSAFTPKAEPVQAFLQSGLGKALALLGVVYVWKTVSPLIAILLTVAFLRSTAGLFEGVDETLDKCAGKPNKNCDRLSSGLKYDPTTCKCTDGREPMCEGTDVYDSVNKKCGPSQGSVTAGVPTQSDLALAAPIVSSPTTSTAPMTTPGAAQDMASVPLPPPTPSPVTAVGGSNASTPGKV